MEQSPREERRDRVGRAALLSVAYSCAFVAAALGLSAILGYDLPAAPAVALLGVLAWLAMLLPLVGRPAGGWPLSRGSRARTIRARETTLTIEPDYSKLSVIRDLVEEGASAAGMSDSEIWDMKVASTEALANAIEHAPLAPDQLIHLRIRQEEDQLQLEIVGGGSPPGQRTPSDPARGRGIGIMSALMDEVELSHARGASRIRLCKRSIPAPADAGGPGTRTPIPAGRSLEPS